MSPTREQLLTTTSRFFEAWSTWDFDTMASMRTPTCVGESLPPSRRRSTTQETCKTKLESSKAIFKSMKMRIINEDDTVVDELNCKVAVRVGSKSETVVGPFENEWIYLLTMNEDGTKVDKIQHFCDTLLLSRLEKRLESELGIEMPKEL